ncbi:MAG: hypothetical protein ABIP19_01945 [Dermatophilaceae bacterium]
MLIAVAIVPGPPAFVAELMGSAAHELDDLRQTADSLVSRTVSDLIAASAASPSSSSLPAQLVVVGPGEPGEFKAVGSVAFGSFGRDVAIPALVEGEPTEPQLPTPLMVARYLASRDVDRHPEHADLWASARWVTTSGAEATALGDQVREDRAPVALILVADGAACHGPKAPRAEDSRAHAFDDSVCAALASGEPGRLARIDVDLGHELGASGPQVWPVLSAAAGAKGTGEVLWRGAPYGVGWAVAAWRPAAPEVARA